MKNEIKGGKNISFVFCALIYSLKNLLSNTYITTVFPFELLVIGRGLP